jgi:hypothetical protein
MKNTKSTKNYDSCYNFINMLRNNHRNAMLKKTKTIIFLLLFAITNCYSQSKDSISILERCNCTKLRTVGKEQIFYDKSLKMKFSIRKNKKNGKYYRKIYD